MRIAMIGQKGIPATYGGVERHVEELSLRLVERGHHVTVYTRPYYTPPSFHRYKSVELVSRHSLSTKHLDAISHTTICSVEAAWHDADIVHYHAMGPALMSWIPRLAHKTVACTIHGQDWKRPKWGTVARMALKLGERAAMSLPDVTISVSTALADELSRTYGRTVHYVPNGITLVEDTDRYWLDTLGLRPHRYVLFASRIVPEKGLHHLLDVWRRGGVDVPLVVAGDSSFSRDYVDRLKSTAPRNVHFVGYVLGARLASLFREAAMFVLPSDVEGLAIVLLEALGYGVPVVASDIPSNREVLRTVGTMFKAGDVDELQRCVLDTLEDLDRARALAGQARERICAEYDWDRVAEATESLYRAALQPHGV